MLLPQELKNHNFSRALRGYSADEVEEYIAFVVSKYEEAYRENDETGRKLAAAMKSLEELRAREKKVAALEAAIRKAAEQILSEADQKRRQIVSDAEEYADRIIAEADAHVASQEQQFLKMQKEAAAFRDTLFAAYSNHIDQLEELAAAAAEEAFTDPLPAASLTETAEEIVQPAPAEADDIPDAEAEPETAAEAEDADEPVWQEEDVYSDEELYGDEEEAAEDDTYTEGTDTAAADEDVYSEEELADADLSAPLEEPEQIEIELPAKPETEPEEEIVDAALFSALFAERENADKADEDLEEIPWAEETENEAEEIEEIPATDNGDDALLRELHEVFSREFAAVTENEPAEKQTIFLPIEEPAETADDHDRNLDELKKRMGLTDEKKTANTGDFDFIPENDTEEKAEKRFGLFGKKK